MRNVAWTLATLTILGLATATADAGPWGPPGPARGGPGRSHTMAAPDYHGHQPSYPGWRGPVVVQRPAYYAPPRPWYRPVAPPPPVLYAPVVPPPVVYPPAWYGPSVGLQYRGRDFGISIGF